MNLKTFHVVFIACATALAFLFGAWVLGSQTLTGTSRQLAAFASFGVGIGLIAYETWFLRSSRGRQ
jgi:uncharacterized membrane protein